MMKAFPSQFSSSRLTIARERRGLTKRTLAQMCNVTPGAITQFETGDALPATSTFQRIVLALQFPATWFEGPDVELISSMAPSFRARRKMTAGLRLKSVRAGDLAASFLFPDLRSRFRLPCVDVPDLSKHSPEEAALLLRRAWKLGEGPLPNIIPLVESRGIFAFYTTEQNDCLDAWSVWQNQQPFIMLNLLKTDGERERFDCCHEIAHLVLHRHEKRAEGREIEDEADRFASSFLIPDSMFRIECPRVPDLHSFLKLKARWGVSVAALLYKAHRMNILSRHHYDYAFKELSKRNWRNGEPNSIQRSTSKIHAFALAKLSERGLNADQYADHLSLPIDQLWELMPLSKQYSTLSGQESKNNLLHFGTAKSVHSTSSSDSSKQRAKLKAI